MAYFLLAMISQEFFTNNNEKKITYKRNNNSNNALIIFSFIHSSRKSVRKKHYYLFFSSIFLLFIHLFIHSKFGIKPTDRLLLLIDMHKQTQRLHATKCKIRLSFSTVKESDVKIRRLSKLITQGTKVIDKSSIFRFYMHFWYPRVFVFIFFFFFSNSRFSLQFPIFFIQFLQFFFRFLARRLFSSFLLQKTVKKAERRTLHHV